MRRRSTVRASFKGVAIRAAIVSALFHQELDDHGAQLRAGGLEPAHRVQNQQDEHQERQQAEEGLERERGRHLRRTIAIQLARARNQHMDGDEAGPRERAPLLPGTVDDAARLAPQSR